MDKRISQIIYCLILGYAGMFMGMFVFDIVKELLKRYPDQPPHTYFMLILSLSVYISWIFGVSTSAFDRLDYFVRGILSTAFLNFGIIWATKERMGLNEITLETIPPVIIFMVVVNTLIAIFAGKAFEEYLQQKKKKMGTSPMILTYVIFMPVPIIGTFWLVMYSVEKLFALYL